MTTLSTEDTTRQSADDRDPDSLNVFLQEQAHTLRHGRRGGSEDTQASSEARWRGYDGALSDARGIREFFRDLDDLDYQNRHRPVATVKPLV